MLLLALLCLSTALRLTPPPAHASTIKVEYEDTFDDVPATEETATEVKAAFLLRFPDFIGWRNPPGDTLRIGVSGDSALYSILTRLAEHENQSGLGAPYTIFVEDVQEEECLSRCDILVLGAEAPPAQLELVSKAHEKGTLTVGIWEEPRGDTIIRLYRDKNRVRFSISQGLAKEAGLLISSKLLKIADDQSSRVTGAAIRILRG